MIKQVNSLHGIVGKYGSILQALRTLCVADNHLQHLPSGIAGLVSLKQLWAYGNQLQSLPADLMGLPAIKSRLAARCDFIVPFSLCCTCLLLFGCHCKSYCIVSTALNTRPTHLQFHQTTWHTWPSDMCVHLVDLCVVLCRYVA